MPEINDCCRVHLAKMEQAQAKLRHLEREHAERLERITELNRTIDYYIQGKKVLWARLKESESLVKDLMDERKERSVEPPGWEDQREELWERIQEQQGEIKGLRFALKCLAQKRRKS